MVNWLIALSPVIFLAVLIAIPERRDPRGVWPDMTRRDAIIGFSGMIVVGLVAIILALGAWEVVTG